MASATDIPAVEALAHRTRQLMGDAADDWTPDETSAWLGLLLSHRILARGFGKAVEAEIGLSPTALGLLGRLSETPGERLRTSALAEDIGLSLSRTSRVVDALEARGFVTRRSCAKDSRAIDVVLSQDGRDAARRAQAVSAAWVREHFLSDLTPEETATLASVFERFAARGSGTPCSSLAAAVADDGGC